MPDTLLAAAIYLAFTIGELDASVDPPIVRRKTDGAPIVLRADQITGWIEERDYGGEPCVRILVGNNKLFVLGPSSRIHKLLEAHRRKP